MKLIDFKPEHQEEFFRMCSEFFSSPAVCHQIDKTAMETTFRTALAGSPYMRGLMLTKEETIMGYVLLSFTYSNEVGGMVVWVEELFLKENYRGKGYGKQVFSWLHKTYQNAKRFRLEVTAENEGAKRLYQKLGFSPLPYEQMVIDK